MGSYVSGIYKLIRKSGYLDRAFLRLTSISVHAFYMRSIVGSLMATAMFLASGVQIYMRMAPVKKHRDPVQYRSA